MLSHRSAIFLERIAEVQLHLDAVRRILSPRTGF